MFTREFDYAVRVIRTLSDGEQQPVKQICSNENIPQAYAYRILKKLENASMVASTRGIYGGYRLVRSSDEISLLDVYIALEEKLCITECLKEGYECENNIDGRHCNVRGAFLALQDDFVQLLKSKSLAQVLGSNDLSAKKEAP